MSVDLTNTFRDRAKRQQDNEELLGLQSEAVAGRQLKAGALSRHHKEVAERTRKQQEKSDDIFYVLLDQLGEYADNIERGFVDKYGENYAEYFAMKYLDEEERVGLKTAEEKIDAILEKYFENGKLKPEYADSEDASELQDLYNMREARKLAAESNLKGDTPEMREKVDAFAKEANVFEINEFHQNAESATAREKVAEVSDAKVEAQAKISLDGVF